ncbi:HAMP domain-containing histidine kinase [Patescibacteria group bacterium]|nr:HAMP domain-containing histidine kinase [Patescibacteria group bacterium]
MDSSLENIYQAGLNFLAPLTLQETYMEIVQQAIKLSGGDEGRIILYEQRRFKLVYAFPKEAYVPRKIFKHGYVYAAFTKKQTFLINQSQIAKTYPDVTKRAIKSALFIPLIYRHQSIGVLVVQSKGTESFDQHDLDLLRTFGSVASLAIRKAQLNYETQKAVEIRDFFIAMVAHELRTPLTTINGYVHLLQTKIPDNHLEKTWLKQLSLETRRLTGLINELLTLNRIKAGFLDYIWSECRISQIINKAVMDFKRNYPERKIIFHNFLTEKQEVIIGDSDKLLQVLDCLIDNAIKFSGPQTQITIEAKIQGTNILITIRDEGMGIAANNISKVMGEFYKTQQNNQQGLGLGLFLVKTIVSQHHGNVAVHSKENVGTTVEVKLRRIVN